MRPQNPDITGAFYDFVVDTCETSLYLLGLSNLGHFGAYTYAKGLGLKGDQYVNHNFNYNYLRPKPGGVNGGYIGLDSEGECMVKEGPPTDIVAEALAGPIREIICNRGVNGSAPPIALTPHIVAVSSFRGIMIGSRMLDRSFMTAEEKTKLLEKAKNNSMLSVQEGKENLDSRARTLVALVVTNESDGNSGNVGTVRCGGQSYSAIIDAAKTLGIELRYLQERGYLLSTEEMENPKLLRLIIKHAKALSEREIINNLALGYSALLRAAPLGFTSMYCSKNKLVTITMDIVSRRDQLVTACEQQLKQNETKIKVQEKAKTKAEEEVKTKAQEERDKLSRDLKEWKKAFDNNKRTVKSAATLPIVDTRSRKKSEVVPVNKPKDDTPPPSTEQASLSTKPPTKECSTTLFIPIAAKKNSSKGWPPPSRRVAKFEAESKERVVRLKNMFQHAENQKRPHKIKQKKCSPAFAMSAWKMRKDLRKELERLRKEGSKQGYNERERHKALIEEMPVYATTSLFSIGIYYSVVELVEVNVLAIYPLSALGGVVAQLWRNSVYSIALLDTKSKDVQIGVIAGTVAGVATHAVIFSATALAAQQNWVLGSTLVVSLAISVLIVAPINTACMQL